MNKINFDGLLGLNLEEIKIIYLRCRGDTVEEIAEYMEIGESTIYSWMPEICKQLEVENWRELREEACITLRRIIPDARALDEGWPEAFREKIEALREPQVSKNEKTVNQETTSTTQSTDSVNGTREDRTDDNREHERRSIPWPLVAIPMLIVCLFCIPGVLLGRQVVGTLFGNGAAPFAQATPTRPAPTETPTHRPTNTRPVVFTQTSSPTLTHTPLPPTPTSPSPTFTSTPTETSTPRPPALFETSFDSGMPDGMEMVYGDIDFVEGELLAHELTLLSIGEDTWKNYQVEYETRKHTYCWGLKNNGIAAHATGPENMIVWSWNYCEAGWFELVDGDWVKITGSNSVGVNPGRSVTIRLVAEDGNFTVYANNIKRTSYYDEKYTQGKVYIVLHNQSVIDNIYISLLP